MGKQTLRRGGEEQNSTGRRSSEGQDCSPRKRKSKMVQFRDVVHDAEDMVEEEEDEDEEDQGDEDDDDDEEEDEEEEDFDERVFKQALEDIRNGATELV